VILGVVFTGLTVWQEGRAPAPMLPMRLFGNATILGGMALSATNSLSWFGASLLLPLFFQYIKHTSAAESGLLTTPFLLAFVVLSYAGGKISKAMGRTKPPMILALGFCTLGLGLLATMQAGTPLVLCEIYSVILGGGVGLVQPNITVLIQNAAARPDVGVATGCMLLFRAIGGAFGATLAAAMFLAFGFWAGFGVCALVSLVALGISVAMKDSVLRS
jgi:MFS family permease